MTKGSRILFIPGASGRGEFWDPVRELLSERHRTAAIDWPGVAGLPADPTVASYDDLVQLAVNSIKVLGAPAVIVAQSAGGYVAMRVAIERSDLVSHLVLAATSAGVDTASLGASDWQADMRWDQPSNPDWLYERTPDLSENIRSLDIPTLLVWATDDPISPVAIGHHLEQLLAPSARLITFDSDDHWVAREHAAAVAAEIESLLQ